MADDLTAVVLTVPESGDPRTAKEWARVEKHAGLPSIEAHLTTARRALGRAQRVVDRWEALRVLRTAQVEAGEWPPKVERVT